MLITGLSEEEEEALTECNVGILNGPALSSSVVHQNL